MQGQRADLTAQGRGGRAAVRYLPKPLLLCNVPTGKKGSVSSKTVGRLCCFFFLKFYDSFSSPPLSPPPRLFFNS